MWQRKELGRDSSAETEVSRRSQDHAATVPVFNPGTRFVEEEDEAEPDEEAIVAIERQIRQ